MSRLMAFWPFAVQAHPSTSPVQLLCCVLPLGFLLLGGLGKGNRLLGALDFLGHLYDLEILERNEAAVTVGPTSRDQAFHLRQLIPAVGSVVSGVKLASCP